MKIFLGADHAGFFMKEDIKKWLEKNFEVVDLGSFEEIPGDDYVQYAQNATRSVLENPDSRALLFCGSGVGMAIAANREKGIRAAVAWNSEIAKETREDNDSNILAIPARFLKVEEVEVIIKVWLETPFTNTEQYVRRIKMMDE